MLLRSRKSRDRCIRSSARGWQYPADVSGVHCPQNNQVGLNMNEAAANTPTMLVAQRPQFGLFANNTW